jgi:hypothetical protein
MKKNLSILGVAVLAVVAILSPLALQAQSLGHAWVIQNLILPPATTNSYPPYGPNAIFIGVSDIGNLGLQLESIVPTNNLSTNLSGPIVFTFAKTVDGIVPESTPSVVIALTSNNNWFTVNAANGLYNTNGYSSTGYQSIASICTNLVCPDAAGYFLESIVSTNQGVNSATNIISIAEMPKAAKVEAIPSTTRN